MSDYTLCIIRIVNIRQEDEQQIVFEINPRLHYHRDQKVDRGRNRVWERVLQKNAVRLFRADLYNLNYEFFRPITSWQ